MAPCTRPVPSPPGGPLAVIGALPQLRSIAPTARAPALPGRLLGRQAAREGFCRTADKYFQQTAGCRRGGQNRISQRTLVGTLTKGIPTWGVQSPQMVRSHMQTNSWYDVKMLY